MEIGTGYSDVTFVGGTATNSLTLNVAKGADLTADITGGAGNDTIVITGTEANSITLTGDLSVGANTISGAAITAANIDISGLTGLTASVTLTGNGAEGGKLVGSDAADILIAQNTTLGIGKAEATAASVSFPISVTDGTVDYDTVKKAIFTPDTTPLSAVTLSGTINSADTLAAAVAAGTYTGFTASSSGSTVTFTSDTKGASNSGIGANPALAIKASDGSTASTGVTVGAKTIIEGHDAITTETPGIQYILDGGEGIDTFVINKAATAVDTYKIGEAQAVINGYEQGEKIYFGNDNSSTTAVVFADAEDDGYNNLSEFLAAANTLVGAATKTGLAAQVGQDVYIAYGTSANKLLGLVQLVGADINEVDTADIFA